MKHRPALNPRCYTQACPALNEVALGSINMHVCVPTLCLQAAVMQVSNGLRISNQLLNL